MCKKDVKLLGDNRREELKTMINNKNPKDAIILKNMAKIDALSKDKCVNLVNNLTLENESNIIAKKSLKLNDIDENKKLLLTPEIISYKLKIDLKSRDIMLQNIDEMNNEKINELYKLVKADV